MVLSYECIGLFSFRFILMLEQPRQIAAAAHVQPFRHPRRVGRVGRIGRVGQMGKAKWIMIDKMADGKPVQV